MTIQEFISSHEDYLRDESRRAGRADSIAFPTNEAEVRDALKAAAKNATPVTVQGGRTGVAGGATPDGGLILNLSRMTRIRGMRFDSSSEQFFLTVEPGVLLSDVREALAESRFATDGWSEESLAALEALRQRGPFFFPPDPTETSASIGGMVVCNASGARSFHYGPTAGHIEALRLLTPDGSALSLRRGDRQAQGRSFRLELDDGNIIQGQLPRYDPPAVKNAAGYRVADDIDLVDLFIGMEGTLGVVTEIELRLSPEPKAIWGLTAFLPLEKNALALTRRLREIWTERRRSDTPPAERLVALEFFNTGILELLRKQKATNPAFAEIPEVPPNTACALYIEFHGDDEDRIAEAAMEAGEAIAQAGGDEDATWLADDPREMQRLSAFRHAAPESVNLLIDERRRNEPSLTKLGTDMSVPDDALEWVFDLYNTGVADARLQAVIFGHIGDNHVHVNILPRNLDDYARGKDIYLDWARQIVDRGGSVSAEHGIGKLKTPFLEMMLGPKAIDEMRALKRLFDPEGILNRGNLFS